MVPHVFDLTRHLKEIDDPNIKKSLEDQMETMDPNNFMKLARERYGNSLLE
jgi:hypothetical protein